MASSFTWLDTSERDRRLALEVIDAFRERETRDELGLGAIRDGLADLLFPGTTTIQTRARYFLFIPWIYRSLESRQVPSRRVAAEARAAEIALIDPLAREQREGVIGIEARAGLKRLPSSIYWQGMGSWGIRTFPGSQAEYHRSLDAYHRRRAAERRGDDGGLASGIIANWHTALPPAPRGFPEGASMALRADEAEYLRDRISLSHSGSLLAHLVQGSAWEPVPFGWLHPNADMFPQRNRIELRHARAFSELMHGAQLLYNLMLAEKARSDERVAGYRSWMTRWRAAIDARWDDLSAWASTDVPAFWRLLDGVRLGGPARSFVEGWIARILRLGPGGVADDPDARRLVHDREVRLKGRLARLENMTALANWGGAAGASQMDVRWGITQQLLRDILAPLDQRHA